MAVTDHTKDFSGLLRTPSLLLSQTTSLVKIPKRAVLLTLSISFLEDNFSNDDSKESQISTSSGIFSSLASQKGKTGHYSRKVVLLERMTFKRPGKGLNFGGIELYVILPMITAFIFPALDSEVMRLLCKT